MRGRVRVRVPMVIAALAVCMGSLTLAGGSGAEGGAGLAITVTSAASDGSGIVVAASVRNDGPVAVGSLEVAAIVDGSRHGCTSDAPTVEPEASVAVTCTIDGAAAGRAVVELVASATDADGTRVAAPPVHHEVEVPAPLPALEVQVPGGDVVVDAGARPELSVAVANTGGGVAVAPVVSVRADDGAPWCDVAVAPIEPGASAQATCVGPVLESDTELEVEAWVPVDDHVVHSAPITVWARTEIAATLPSGGASSPGEPGGDPKAGEGAASIDDVDTAEVTPSLAVTADPPSQEVPYGATAQVDVTIRNDGDVALDVRPGQRGEYGYWEVTDGCGDDAIVTGSLAGPLAVGEARTVTCTFPHLTSYKSGLSGLLTADYVPCEGCSPVVYYPWIFESVWSITVEDPPILVEEEPVNGFRHAPAGEGFPFRYFVSNRADAPVSSVSIEVAGQPQCDRDFATIAPGAEGRRVVECEVPWDDRFLDDASLVVTATSTSPGVDGLVSHDTFFSRPFDIADAPTSLDVAFASTDLIVDEGATLDAEVIVRNPEQVPIRVEQVSMDGWNSCDIGELLQPGGEVRATCETRPVERSRAVSAWVKGFWSPCVTCNERQVWGDATAPVRVRPRPLAVEVTPRRQLVPSGEIAQFSVTVRNDGTEAIESVSVRNLRGTDCDDTSYVLDPGASQVVQCTSQGPLTSDAWDSIGASGSISRGGTSEWVYATEVYVSLLVTEAPSSPTAGVTFEVEAVHPVVGVGEDAFYDVTITFPASFPNVYWSGEVWAPDAPSCSGWPLGSPSGIGRPDGGQVRYRCMSKAFTASEVDPDFDGSFRSDFQLVLDVDPYGDAPRSFLLADAVDIEVVGAEGLRLQVEPLVDPVPADVAPSFRVTVENQGPDRIEGVSVSLVDLPWRLTTSSTMSDIEDCAREVGALDPSGPGATVTFTCTAAMDQRQGFVSARASGVVSDSVATSAAGDRAVATTVASYGYLVPADRYEVTAELVDQSVDPGDDATVEVTLRQLSHDAPAALAFDHYEVWSISAPGCYRRIPATDLVLEAGVPTASYRCTVRWGLDFVTDAEVDLRAYGFRWEGVDPGYWAAYYLGDASDTIVVGAPITTTTVSPTTTTTAAPATTTTVSPTTTTTVAPTTTTTVSPTTTTTVAPSAPTTAPPAVPITTTTLPAAPNAIVPPSVEEPEVPADDPTASTTTTSVDGSTTTAAALVPLPPPTTTVAPGGPEEIALAPPEPTSAAAPDPPAAVERVIADVGVTQSTQPFALVSVIVALVVVLLLGGRPILAERRPTTTPQPRDHQEDPS